MVFGLFRIYAGSRKIDTSLGAGRGNERVMLLDM